MRVAVTGASGLIGTALCRHLQERGDRVVRVVRRSPKPGEGVIEWHPERDGNDEPLGAGLFDALLRAAANRGKSAAS